MIALKRTLKRILCSKIATSLPGVSGAASVFVVFVLTIRSVFALPDVVVSTSITDTELTGAIGLEDQINGGFGLSNVDYLYAPGSGKQANYNQIEAHLEAQGTGRVIQGKLNLEALAIVNPKATYTLEAPELYVGTSPILSEVVQLKVGRELHHWSHLDEEFELGIWEPRLRWDYVRPEEVGLAGVFVDVETPFFQFTIMGSPGFVPDRGVPEEFQNGGIYSQSPYFTSPATSIDFNGVTTTNQYSLNAPRTASILLHPAFSAMARVGGKQGIWGSIATAYKPMNQLLLSYNANLSTADFNNPMAQTTIYPRIAYNSLISSELGYESPHFAFWISELEDRPIDDQATEGSTYQVMTPSHAISPAFEYRMGDLKYAPTRFKVEALRQWGGNSSDLGTFATGNGSVFEMRYPYQSAVIFGVQTPVQWMGLHDLNFRYKMLYDFGHLGNIQSTDLDYKFNRDIVVNLGLDVLTSHEGASATDPIAEYRANDRIRVGMSYVF